MTTRDSFASVLGPTIARYLALKQALGRRYDVERRILEHLDRFLEASGSDLTPDSFTSWCQMQAHLASGVRRSWMRITRNLCLYRRRSEPSCFVPDAELFPPNHAPLRPFIFSEAEIARLLHATDQLNSTPLSPLRREVFRLAIVLLYTCGLRRGELLRLTLGDYDPQEQVLRITASKFHKSRLLPLSADATLELDNYLRRRRSVGLPTSAEAPLLCNRHRGGRTYTGAGFAQGLRGRLRSAGIRTGAGDVPRVHDIRHTFAVHALVRWYRSGADVQAKLPFLAAYMGHVSIVSTEHYLQFIEPLATLASERFATHCGALVTAREVETEGAS
jgi:integrase